MVPFEQGIFLSPLAEQSSRMFDFVFKMFAVGYASLPEGGMGEVPRQIAAELPEGDGAPHESLPNDGETGRRE